jgi:hypothetical protein
MNRVSRYWAVTGVVGLLLAGTCLGGVESPAKSERIHKSTWSSSNTRAVTIVSQPLGARIMINGEYVGVTPLTVDFYVDNRGRVMRDIEMRAISPVPLAVQEIRRFPAAATDGDASWMPHIVDFDLNIHPVLVIR